MKVLIDGSGVRIKERRAYCSEIVGGQLLTPLTGYRLAETKFGIDNGAFSGMDDKKIAKFTRILSRYYEQRNNCFFVAVPDKVADHKATLDMWHKYNHLADGYAKAFVAQDGFDELPEGAGALFIGGSTEFKDSNECYDIVSRHISIGMHVHIGRVTMFKRFVKFHELGAHTCDGSGLSMYDGTFKKLTDKYMDYIKPNWRV